MPVNASRPAVSNLVFHLFERSIHPELFHTCCESVICQDDYCATLRICEAGHVVSFRSAKGVACEVTASSDQPLPRCKHSLEKRISSCRDICLNLPSGVQYQVSYQLETLDHDVFLNFHEELLVDCCRARLAYQFAGGSRMAPGAISLIKTEVWPRSLLVHAYHTYPENCAIVKTQSLFEL